MDNYIDRQAAIDALKNRWKKTRNYEGIGDDIAEECELYLKLVPPAQPEIIRCKDCKYAEYIDDVKTLWCTECGQGRTVAPNDFCSYAERREVTT